MKPFISRNQIPTSLHHNKNIESSERNLPHELSVEQQAYFKFLTESCFNEQNNENPDVLHRLSSDVALQPLLPRLLLFLAKTIEVNIHLHDLNFIIQSLSILKMLTQNRFISFDKYLHSIIPTLLTCLLCIFDTQKNDHILFTLDHQNSNNYSIIWIIREFASDHIAYFESKYTHALYFSERITSIIKSYLTMKDKTTTYSILYASIRTLLLINRQNHDLSVKNILEYYNKRHLIDVDFDLNVNEQKVIFNQKINELLDKHRLTLEDK